ncbi:hypothetical protein DKX38_026894 [Salix brachista]|uniref:Uncharacterized protein n=1 Tax=Salix brachista TaxID=2182728 RepID=A0A5N5JCH3_9ROSI|nr:hypothetical protein DKX38_026894 [Salix brachista]
MQHHTQPSAQKAQPPPAANSWAEKVRISDSTTRFTLDPIQRQPVGSQLLVTEEMLHHNSSQWTRCVVGFIPGFENVPPNEAAMQAVMEKGPWLFGGKAILLQQWHPSYKFDKNKISKLPVWVRLHGLPFPLWSQTGLSLAASVVGRPLSCDSQTYNCERLEYARLCVEIDASLPKVTSFDIVSPLSAEPLTVEVEYEWMPPHCVSCKLYGHSCKKQQQPSTHDTAKPERTLARNAAVAQTHQHPHLKPPIHEKLNDPTPSPFTSTLVINSTPQVLPVASIQKPPINPNPKTTPTPQPKYTLLKPYPQGYSRANEATTSQPENPPSTENPTPKTTSHHSCDSTREHATMQISLPTEMVSKHTAIVTFGYIAENCTRSMMDPSGSKPTISVTTDDSSEESSTTATPVEDQDHDHSPPLSPKTITCEAKTLTTSETITITFVYGGNTPAAMKTLWEYITNISPQFNNTPWVLLGVFNAVLHASQRVGGDTRWLSYHEDFRNALHQAELTPLPYTGMAYTWNNSQHGDRNIQKKLDWVLGNCKMIQCWPASSTKFLPRSVSDHIAAVLHLGDANHSRHHHFRFLSIWTAREDFLSTINEVWQQHIQGSPMHRLLLRKLKSVKELLKNYHKHNTSHISTRVCDAKKAWDIAQNSLDSNPTNAGLKEEERRTTITFARLSHEEEAILKQRSRIQWLQLGDKNTAFFHKSIVHRQTRNRIMSLRDGENTLISSQQDIGNLAVVYFENILKADYPSAAQIPSHLFPTRISEDSAQLAGWLVINPSKSAIFTAGIATSEQANLVNLAGFQLIFGGGLRPAGLA